MADPERPWQWEKRNARNGPGLGPEDFGCCLPAASAVERRTAWRQDWAAWLGLETARKSPAAAGPRARHKLPKAG